MNLFSVFENSVENFPENDSLVIENKKYSYKELHEEASKISHVLSKYNSKNIGIYSYRSLSAFSGILASLQAGKTYVPLNPKFPEVRNSKIIQLSHAEILIVDKSCIAQLVSISSTLNPKTIIITPEILDADIPTEIKSTFTIYTQDTLVDCDKTTEEVVGDSIAYIMFTSGSTGVPKGVPVSHKNVLAYVKYLDNRYQINKSDRFSQTFDITFDLSVHDMFLAWNGGASLYVVPEKVLMAPAKFIRENDLTMWFSVPSLAQFMNKFRMLKPDVFPTLRYSLFCGEPLPKSIAISWQKAASNSTIENIYGPTEATIGITHYKVPKEEDLILEQNGIVSIGQVFTSQEFCLINENNSIEKERGELCLSGSQVTKGYWENLEKTKEQYFSFEGETAVWYKTGDIVQITDNNIFYITRKDFQVKVRGYRIELGEINLALSNFTGVSLVYTIPHPVVDGVATSLYSFIDKNCTMSKTAIIQHLSTLFPEYMIPKEIIFVDNFPLNSNGKIDRKRLTELL